MKTAIFAIALIISTTASAFNMTHEHKDWVWGSEMNNQGSFLASTKAIDDTQLTFNILVTPEDGKCFVSYLWMKVMKNDSAWEETRLTDIPVKFQIDKRPLWTANASVHIIPIGNSVALNTYVTPDTQVNSIKDLLKGRQLLMQLDEKDMPTNAYSLMGSTAAMTAIYQRCQDHLAAFPDYNANTDSRAAMKGKIEKQRLQAVTDKAASI